MVVLLENYFYNSTSVRQLNSIAKHSLIHKTLKNRSEKIMKRKKEKNDSKKQNEEKQQNNKKHKNRL